MPRADGGPHDDADATPVSGTGRGCFEDQGFEGVGRAVSGENASEARRGVRVRLGVTCGVTCKISLTEEYLSGERMSAGLQKKNLFLFTYNNNINIYIYFKVTRDPRGKEKSGGLG